MSFLIAIILGLQFYFTNQTQQDVIAELTELSTTIREAADVHIIREFGADSLLDHNFIYYSQNDADKSENKSKFQYLWKTLNKPKPDRSSGEKNIDLHIEHVPAVNGKPGIIRERMIRGPARDTKFKFSSPDSLLSEFEEIIALRPQH